MKIAHLAAEILIEADFDQDFSRSFIIIAISKVLFIGTWTIVTWYMCYVPYNTVYITIAINKVASKSRSFAKDENLKEFCDDHSNN